MAKVLVVDDLRADAFRVTGILKKAGYECRTAHDGRSAFDQAKEDRPDLILMDIVMGDEDGFRACRRLKKDPETQKIPVIFISSKSDENAEWWARRIGAERYLMKPVSPQDLLSAVREVVG